MKHTRIHLMGKRKSMFFMAYYATSPLSCTQANIHTFIHLNLTSPELQSPQKLKDPIKVGYYKNRGYKNRVQLIIQNRLVCCNFWMLQICMQMTPTIFLQKRDGEKERSLGMLQSIETQTQARWRSLGNSYILWYILVGCNPLLQ